MGRHVRSAGIPAEEWRVLREFEEEEEEEEQAEESSAE